MDIAEFLLARIDEDEAAAQAGERGDVEFPGTYVDTFGARNTDDDLAEFLRRFTPDRVLAECEAKREIVRGYRDAWEMAKQFARAGRGEEAQAVRYSRVGLESALIALALPFAAHPDYQPEWIAMATTS